MARTATTANGLIEAEIHFTPSEVLAMGTPEILIPAQGPNTIIDVISVVGAVRNVTTPYATHTNLELHEGGVLWSNNQILPAASPIAKIFTQNGGATMAPNTDLTIVVTGGNPTAGDGDLFIYVTYQVYQLS